MESRWKCQVVHCFLWQYVGCPGACGGQLCYTRTHSKQIFGLISFKHRIDHPVKTREIALAYYKHTEYAHNVRAKFDNPNMDISKVLGIWAPNYIRSGLEPPNKGCSILKNSVGICQGTKDRGLCSRQMEWNASHDS
jgi:hypothetical protein